MRAKLWTMLVAGAAIWSSPASARWLRAASPHFVVYADTTERDIVAFTTRLERLDGALRYLRATPADPAEAVSPVTIYVVPSVAAVQRLASGKNAGGDIYGFYVPRAAGSVAFTPKASGSGGTYDLKPETVLFHEYAHHFLLGQISVAVPPWFSEGYAEFVSTARITPEAVQIGGPAMHRAYDLVMGDRMPVAKLFAYGTKRPTERETQALYARGWLLTHFIIFHQDRMKQFQTYIDLLNAGKPGVEAGQAAFGDLKQLDRELDRYLNASRISVMRLPTDKLPAPKVSYRPLTAGEAALIELRMRSERGVDRSSAPVVYAAGAKIAAAYPTDAAAQGWLAEMAYDAGQDAAAEAAADRAIATDPASSQALLYKARVLMRRARTGDPAGAKEARRLIVRANHADPNDAEALLLNYQTYRLPGQTPNPTAIRGLQRAMVLVPQDPGLRYAVARQELLDGEVKQARSDLAPLAYDPHTGGDNVAAKLVALIDAGTSGPDAVAAIEAGKDGTETLGD